MLTLEIGKNNLSKSINGFTLIEILLVVLIIGIMSVVGANVINSQSVERQIMNHAKGLEAELNYICDLAVLENRAYGLEWYQSGRQVLKHQAGDWIPQKIERISNGEWLKKEVLLDGVNQILDPDLSEIPHVICQTDGSFNTFEIRWSPVESPQNNSVYSLKSLSPWQLTGAWLEN